MEKLLVRALSHCDPTTNCRATMDSSASELEGEVRKIGSWDETVPRELRAWKANRTKKVVRRLEQWEVDGAMTLEVFPREIPGSPGDEDSELMELRDLMVKVMWRWSAKSTRPKDTWTWSSVPDDDFEPGSDSTRM